MTKKTLEFVLDRKNMSSAKVSQKLYSTVADQLERAIRLGGDQIGVEGAWEGNETVARMSLDLNRIILYGRPDGTMAPEIQRRVVSVVDAIVAGQGDGPLASDPLEMGMIIAGRNPAAIDWVGARLLSYEPSRIPLLNIAFREFKWPIVDFSPEDIQIFTSDPSQRMAEIESLMGSQNVMVPAGWENATVDRSSKG